MLSELTINNVVLIDKLDLEFKSGLSVLTGETGAGKSILLDSLGLVLGNRAEVSQIRQGTEKLSVMAVFDGEGNKEEVSAFLKEYEIETDGELVIKRTLDKNGKGKIFINDQLISAKLLKEIGKFLVEIHGQYDNQGLLNPANHKSILDVYGNYKDLKQTVKRCWQEYKQAEKARQEAEANIAQAKEDEDNLRHWVEELERIGTYSGEEEELSQKRLELMNAEKLIDNLKAAYSSLNGNFDIVSALRQAQTAMEKANQIVAGKYDAIVDILEQSRINAEEAQNEIEEATNNINLNQNELDKIEERIYALRGIARKHQVSVEELPELLEKFKQRLNNLEMGEDGLQNLRQKEEQARLSYKEQAKELSSQRKATALVLDGKVMAELAPLKMEKAKFITQIEEQKPEEWSEDGIDKIQFTVSTNPNSPQGPLNKIASGGELARFMLALKVNLAQTSNVSTMIFDEVDAGVGGATAKAVGERLARLAKDVQVLVVTHSPQVAASGNHHYKVEKNTQQNVTTTQVRELNGIERQEEIARMLAGETVTQEARAAAKVLLSA